MIIAVVQLKWNEFRRNLINGWNKRRNDQFTKVNNVRERSISILQKRYGYGREQATSELNKNTIRGPGSAEEEKTMKLNLLFSIMDLLTVLAYPIVFLHGKLRQFSNSKESIPLANRLVTGSVTPAK